MSNEVSVKLAELLLVLLQLVILVVIQGFVIPWLRRNMQKHEWDLAAKIAQAAVEAVEQLAAKGVLNPQRKFDEAMMRIREFSERLGIKLTDEQWAMLIEQAVKAMKDAGKELHSVISEEGNPATN